VTIPSNTANGTYYWIVWADGGIARNSHLRWHISATIFR
jgi:hypothetical protein